MRNAKPGFVRARRGLVPLLLVLLCACSRSETPAPGAAVLLIDPAAAPALSHFEDPEVTEASGIQRSLQTPGLFWAHNDSGHDASLYATNAAGRALGRLRLAGVEAIDWEDVSAFVDEGQAQLVVGDIGDNAGNRAAIHLLVFPEPRIPALPAGFEQRIDEYRRVELRYDDGASHDAESMAVDAVSDEILIVTKDALRPEQQALWTAPLRAALATGAAALQFRTDLTSLDYDPLDPEDANPGSFATTGLDLSPDRRELALLSYGQLGVGPGRVFLWQRRDGESWAEALARAAPTTLTVPTAGNAQAEGLGYSQDGRWLLVVAENPPGPTSTLSVLPR